MPTKSSASQTNPRHLFLVLGDQLNRDAVMAEGFDPRQDAVWMAEVAEESTLVWSHQARTALFLSAMRHFAEGLREAGVTVHYRRLEDPANAGSLAGELAAAVRRLKPKRLIGIEPGEWRVRERLRETAEELGVELEWRPDRHFLCSREEFAAHAAGRKQLRMEFFYREMRRRHGVLIDGEEPVGGAWNFDAENRGSFGPQGPTGLAAPAGFAPDAITREVLTLVGRRFAAHPGSLARFDWPVTPEQARVALADFIEHRLPDFGKFQDAMWSGPEEDAAPELSLAGPGGAEARARAYLFHSRLSAALNLKLLDPREVIAAAEAAFRSGHAPLPAVEGFIRQILGWREYVRGIYWRFMPEYRERNSLRATAPLPGFYWTGRTDLRCLRAALGQTLEFGYAHHIQRLMVTGLFALLLGVRPQAVHEWYLAVYVDAVEWVELPNTLGMSQFADGGVMASKPYVASGKYIQRMSNYCAGCRYDPGQATGPRVCPFTTLYWDFLRRHEALLRANPRMTMQLKNLARQDARQRRAIETQADQVRASCAGD